MLVLRTLTQFTMLHPMHPPPPSPTQNAIGPRGAGGVAAMLRVSTSLTELRLDRCKLRDT